MGAVVYLTVALSDWLRLSKARIEPAPTDWNANHLCEKARTAVGGRGKSRRSKNGYASFAVWEQERRSAVERIQAGDVGTSR